MTKNPLDKGRGLAGRAMAVVAAAGLAASCAHRPCGTPPADPATTANPTRPAHPPAAGARAFGGAVLVQGGTLSVGAINNQGVSGPLGMGTSAITLGSADGAAGTFEYTGVNAASDRRFTLAAGGSGAVQVVRTNTVLTLAGAIAGGGGLAKKGPGTLVLSGANTYTGDTRVEAGTLTLAQPCLSDSSGVHIAAGAKLRLDFQGTDAIASLFLGGTRMPPGVYGASATGAAYFEGGGTLTVTNGP